jgi:hypothetical protein
MKKIVTLIFAVLSFTAFTVKAQTENGYVKNSKYSNSVYTNSIGLRAGTELGVTFKHFYKPTWAFEGTVTTSYRALVATALFEKHYELFYTPGFNLFFGGGAHFGSWGDVAYYHHHYYNGEDYYYKTYEPAPSAGVDGIFGLEYKFPKTPFTIGADVKPYFDVFYPGDSWAEAAVSFRYILK